MDKVIKSVANGWSKLVWASERQEIRHEGMRDLPSYDSMAERAVFAVHLLLTYFVLSQWMCSWILIQSGKMILQW